MTTASAPTDPLRTGRTVGLLWLVQLLGAYVLNALILRPILAPPGFLPNAAAEPWRLPTAMLLNLALAALLPTIAIVAWPVFSRHSPRLALAQLCAATVAVALSAVENVGLFVMQRLSAAAAAAASTAASLASSPDALAGGPRLVAAAVRNGAHFSSIFVAAGTILLFYVILYRARLVPRALAALAALAAVSQMTGIGQAFFRGSVDFRFLMPIAVLQLAATVWLLVKGFAPRATEA